MTPELAADKKKHPVLGPRARLVILGVVVTAVHFAACIASLRLFGETGGDLLMQWWLGAGWLPERDQWTGLIAIGLTMPILPLVFLSTTYGISVSLEIQAVCLLINSGLWGAFVTFVYWRFAAHRRAMSAGLIGTAKIGPASVATPRADLRTL